MSVERRMTWDELAAENSRLKAALIAVEVREKQAKKNEKTYREMLNDSQIKADECENELEIYQANIAALWHTLEDCLIALRDYMSHLKWTAEGIKVGEPDKEMERVDVLIHNVEKALSQPSPGAEKWRELLEAAKDSLRCEWETCVSLKEPILCGGNNQYCARERLREVVAALEGVSGDIWRNMINSSGDFNKRKAICRNCRFGKIEVYGYQGLLIFGSPEIIVCNKPKDYDAKTWCEQLPCENPAPEGVSGDELLR